MTYIYSLECPETNNVVYIGKSDNPKYRLRKHIEEAKRRILKSKKNNWIISLNRKGLKPVLRVIDEVPETEWVFWEQHYISLYKAFGFDLKNMTIGGDGGKMTAEAIIKMSNSKRGKKISLKHKQAIGLRNKGNKHAAGNTNRRKEVVCFNVITGSINYYKSSHHAGNELGVLRTSINNNVMGKSKLVNKKYMFFHT